MFKQIKVIVNPAAGQETPVLFKLNEVWQEHNIDWQVSVTLKSGDAARHAFQALDENVDAVAVYGGDGTISEAAHALKGSNIPIALLPGGTSNVMAQHLGIPQDLIQAAELLVADSNIRTVDMVEYDKGTFLLNAGLGIPGQWIKDASRELKNRFGMLAYLVAGIRAAIHAEPSTYTIELEDSKETVDGIACFIANMGSTGVLGMRLSETIHVDDGKLDVIVFRPKDLKNLLSVSKNWLVNGNNSLDGAFLHWQAASATISAEPPQPFNSDGEIVDLETIHASILPKAIHIIVPKS